MVIIEVPNRMYEKVVRELDIRHRSAWAAVDVRPGRRWAVHAPAWERVEALWFAQDLMREVRRRLVESRRL